MSERDFLGCPVRDTRFFKLGEEVLFAEAAQWYIDKRQLPTLENNKKDLKPAELVYSLLLKSLRKTIEEQHKDITPEALILVVESIRSSENFDAQESTLKAVLEVGHKKVTEYHKTKARNGKVPIGLGDDEYVEYTYILDMNKLLRKAVKTEKKSKRRQG